MDLQQFCSATIDPRGYILSCNTAFKKALQASAPLEKDSQNLFELLPADQKESLAAAIRQCTQNPESAVHTNLLPASAAKRNGNYNWIITQDQGTSGHGTLRLIGLVIPTQANRPISLKEPQLFEAFMNHSPIVGWITDREGIMHYMNPIYLKTYGLTHQHLGKSIFELFPKAIAEEYSSNNAVVLKEDDAVESVERAILSDGKEQVLKIFKFPLLVQGEKMVAGWAIDITDQVALQDELQKNLERFYFVKKATSDAIYDWDIQKNIIYRGIGFQTLFGYPDLHGSIRFNFRYIHSSDVEGVKKVVFSSLKEPKTDRWKITYRFRHARGGYKYVVDKAFIIREDGKAARIIGAMQDITEQHQLQEKLVRQEKESRLQVVRSIIETQEKERRQLSLELHDNVNQILSSCKLMLDVVKTDFELHKGLIDKAHHHLQSAISEIRKISHDLNPAELQDIGLIDAIDQLVSDINAAGKTQIKFVHSGLLSKDALKEEDRIAVFRIVQEKLANVLKHSGANNASIQLSHRNNQLYLTMSDDGVGFDVARSKRGIGLKNIQNRVEYYNGSIRLRSAPGKGCQMKIRMHIKQ